MEVDIERQVEIIRVMVGNEIKYVELYDTNIQSFINIGEYIGEI